MLGSRYAAQVERELGAANPFRAEAAAYDLNEVDRQAQKAKRYVNDLILSGQVVKDEGQLVDSARGANSVCWFYALFDHFCELERARNPDAARQKALSTS